MIVGGLLSLAAVCPAFAQATTSQMDGMRLSNDEPIQIESDQLEIKEQEKKAYFTGNVKVVQGTTTMRAGKMTVLYTGEGASMTGGNADIEKIYLDNKVLLSEGPNVFKGCKLTVYMETGEARLDACGGRVEILLDPKSRQQQ